MKQKRSTGTLFVAGIAVALVVVFSGISSAAGTSTLTPKSPVLKSAQQNSTGTLSGSSSPVQGTPICAVTGTVPDNLTGQHEEWQIQATNNISIEASLHYGSGCAGEFVDQCGQMYSYVVQPTIPNIQTPRYLLVPPETANLICNLLVNASTASTSRNLRLTGAAEPGVPLVAPEGTATSPLYITGVSISRSH